MKIIPGELWVFPSDFTEMNFGHLGFSFQNFDINHPKKKIYGFTCDNNSNVSFSNLNTTYKPIIKNEINNFRINKSIVIKVNFHIEDQIYNQIPNLTKLIESKIDSISFLPNFKYAFPWSNKFKRTNVDNKRKGYNCITFTIFNFKPKLINGQIISAGEILPNFNVGSITKFYQDYSLFGI